jgi:5-methylcytosine-specific restriction endonuclease McrA
MGASIEVDFESFGIKPKGELLQRASKVLSGLPAWGDLSFRCELTEDFPMKAAYELLGRYIRCQQVIFRNYGIHTEGWQSRCLVRTFMNACLHHPLQNAIKFRDRIEAAADTSDLHAVALSIIHEYETYCSQKSEVDRHIKAQRKIIDSKREEFFTALEKRDGLFCRSCGSLDKLRIDHEKPLSLGGFSVLANLQILCSFCNGRKGDRSMGYLSRRKNRPRNQLSNNAAILQYENQGFCAAGVR